MRLERRWLNSSPASQPDWLAQEVYFIRQMFVVAHFVLRLRAATVILLGLTLWSGRFPGLSRLHMLYGIAVVLTAWMMAIVATKAKVASNRALFTFGAWISRSVSQSRAGSLSPGPVALSAGARVTAFRSRSDHRCRCHRGPLQPARRAGPGSARSVWRQRRFQTECGQASGVESASISFEKENTITCIIG